MDSETTRDITESVRVGDYILKSKIGGSCLSTVWKAEKKGTGKEVAVKQVYFSKLNKHLKNCLNCELNFLSSVNHPNIIRLSDAFSFITWLLCQFCSIPILYVVDAESCVFLVLEFCDSGNLASYIRHHGRVQEQIARRFMQQLGAGLEILHSHLIIRRDLKPANILLSGPEGDLVLKIADFGLSRIVHPGNYAETVCGSPLYMVPEVLQFQSYDEKVDMWSVGAILFELLNGYPPFHGRTNVQLILPELHPDCVDICSRLLSINPVQCLSFDEFCQHRFLRRKSEEVKKQFLAPRKAPLVI